MASERISVLLKNPFAIYKWLTFKRFTDVVPDRVHLQLLYKARVGNFANLKEPVTFNEKLQWLKLHDHNPLYNTLVDKYAVKDWVSQRIGAEYVTRTYGAWESPEQIDLNTLPDQFVLKTNHDCGGIVICSNRATFDFDSARKLISDHLKRNYYWGCREWPYKDVKPLVFAEEFLSPEERFDEPVDLADYKVMCFNGEPKLIQVHHGRRTFHTQDFYDTQWNRLVMVQDALPMAKSGDERPSQLEKMLELSRVLSAGIAHVRVDWYIVRGKLLFGEMTLYDAGGFGAFDNPADDRRLGEWIDLSLAYGPR